MHCTVTCTIDAEKELVLAALEQQLRRTPGEVEREGDTLVLLGLGPSPRAINRRNRTVFTASTAATGTTLTAEATFQASSMIPPEGQEELVREELERIFGETELSIGNGDAQREHQRAADETARREAEAASAQRAAAEARLREEAEARERVEAHERAMQQVRQREEARERDARAAMQREIRAQALRDAEAARHREAEAAQLREAQAAEARRLANETATAEAAQREDRASRNHEALFAADNVGLRIEEAGEATIAAPHAREPMRELSEAERAAALARRHEAEKRLEDFRRREAERVQAEREATARVLNAATEARQQQPTDDGANSASPASYSEDMRYRDSTAWEEEYLRNPPKPQRRWLLWGVFAACLLAAIPIARHYLASDDDTVEPSSDASGASAPGSSVSASPESALRVWELALRSHDATSQAALYTSPVEEYMGKRNLTHQQLTAAEKAGMAKRRSPWNIRIENVSVDRQGDTATVHLTKHIVEHPQGKPAIDTKIPSVLTLKATGGMWWIASEDDAAAAQTAAASTAPAPKAKPSKRSRRRRGR